MSKIKIGIIGGSGLDDPDILENRLERTVTTPFGNPSDILIEGEIKGIPCVLIARHGRDHSIMPGNVNYRANIWALKTLNCTHVIVSTATGSLQEHIQPGDLVVPHDFIDRTTKRHQTFYDGTVEPLNGVCHLPMSPSFHPKIRQIFIQIGKELGYKIHSKGVVVSIEGPRFSSRSESLMFKQWGGDIINMTTCPEVILAKEAGLIYGAIAIATDYDCWRETCESVCVADVLKVFMQNVQKVKQILIATVEHIAKMDWTNDIDEMKKLVNDNIMLPKGKH